MSKDIIFGVFSKNLSLTFQKFGITLTLGNEAVKEALYLCPISMECHTLESLKQGNLTIEHVPPASLGGKALLLTSKVVNSKDGHTSDKKLLKFFEALNFNINNGEIDVKISSENLDLKGIKAKFSISADSIPKISLNVPHKNIKVLDNRGLFKLWNGVKFDLKWQQQKTIDTKALLKCAYLTAFNVLGYEMLFNYRGLKVDTYGKLLDYLNDLNSSSVDFPIVYKNEHAPIASSSVGVVNFPLIYKSMFVNLTFTLKCHDFNYVVFLPHPDETSLNSLCNLNNAIQRMDKSDLINFRISEVKPQVGT